MIHVLHHTKDKTSVEKDEWLCKVTVLQVIN